MPLNKGVRQVLVEVKYSRIALQNWQYIANIINNKEVIFSVFFRKTVPCTAIQMPGLQGIHWSTHMHALKDSLSAIEIMFQDILDEHGGTKQLSPDVLEQLQRAQRLVNGIRTQAGTPPANDPQQLVEQMELSDLAKRLNSPEKHIIRQAKLRGTINPVVLGTGAERLYKFGLLIQDGASVRLSDKGLAVEALV
jgi:hypothetical protein